MQGKLLYQASESLCLCGRMHDSHKGGLGSLSSMCAEAHTAVWIPSLVCGGTVLRQSSLPLSKVSGTVLGPLWVLNSMLLNHYLSFHICYSYSILNDRDFTVSFEATHFFEAGHSPTNKAGGLGASLGRGDPGAAVESPLKCHLLGSCFALKGSLSLQWAGASCQGQPALRNLRLVGAGGP